MGVTLGDAIVHFRGDKKPLQEAQAQAKKETKAWTVALGNLISSGVTMGVQMASKAIVGLGKAGLQAAIDAMPIEGIRSAFQGIAGDADAMLTTLRKGSLGMVRDAELMRSYNEAAQLVGKSFADQLPDAMGYLSKVSAATGQDMGFMIDSLTKGVGRLSPMILDNLGIQVSLAEATQAAAAKYGVMEDALSKAQIQAGMMDVVLQKLAENTAAMPDVTENVATKWARFKTVLGNLKDMLGEAAIPVLLALIEPVNELAEKYGPRLVEWAQNAGEWLGEKLPEGIDAARDALRYLTRRGFRGVAEDLFKAFREGVRNVDWLEVGKEIGLFILSPIGYAIFKSPAIRDWIIGIYERVKTFITETDWSAVGQAILDKIGEGWAIGVDWVQDHIVTPISTFIAETDWSAVGQAILDKITTTFESIKQTASETVGGWLSGLFGTGGGEGAGGVAGILDAIAGFVSGPGGTALSVIGAIVGLLTGIGAPIAIIIGLVKLLSAAWESNFGGIRDFTLEALGSVNEWIDKGKAKLVGLGIQAIKLGMQFLGSAAAGLMPFIERAKAAWNWITQVAIPILQRWGRAFRRGLQPHIENIWGLLQKFITDIQPDLKLLWDELLDAWSEISTLVREELWPAIRDLLEELGINTDNMEDFSEAFGHFIGWALEVGVALILDKIRDAITGITQAIRIARRLMSAWVRGATLWVDGLTVIVDTVQNGVSALRDLWTELDRLSKMDLAEIFEELTGVELPEWLQSHSPPPLASALAQIADAARALPDLNSKLGGVISPRMGQQYTDDRRYHTVYGGVQVFPSSGGSFWDDLMEASLVR